MSQGNRKPPDPPSAKREPFLMVPLWLLASTRLSLPAKFLLVTLDDHKNHCTGQCNPRVDTLSREMALSTPTIKRVLAELLNSRIVSVTKGQRANSYRVAPRSEWRTILRDQIDPAEIPAGSKRSVARDQIDPAEPRVSLLTEPDLLNQKKNSLSHARNSTSKPGSSPAKKRLAERVTPFPVQQSFLEPEPITALAVSEPQPECFVVWFEQKFWAHYPRKVSKLAAFRAARRVAEKSPKVREAILVGLFRQLPAFESREPEFVPHPSTWLKQQRWLDEPEPPPRPKESQRERNFRIAAKDFLREPSR